MKEGDINDVIDAQVEQQGTSVIAVKDGTFFLFTRQTLEELLTRAIESSTDQVAVFVKHGASS